MKVGKSGTFPRHGFTLTEVLVVIAIIAALLAILIPVTSRMIQGSHRAQSMTNLRQLATALITYTSENNGNIPKLQTDGTPYTAGSSWPLDLMPFLGAQRPNHYEIARWPQVTAFQCPADKAPRAPQWPRGLYLSYGMNLGGNWPNPALTWFPQNDGAYGKSHRKLMEISSPEKTIMFTEVASEGYQNAIYPVWPTFVAQPGGYAPVAKFWDKSTTPYEKCRANFVFYDGHAEFLPVKNTLGRDGTLTNPKGMWTTDPND
jgi:prepilin-type N-terminal cleavage/methylation domain-containing protein/prepilin-type processing-associated H-X9-DG protein